MDICGYIDQQYNILNRSLLEAEIEYQHECFETLKKKYDRYITEADEESDEDDDFEYGAKERIKDRIRMITRQLQKMFEKIANAMQRWIVKILSHSKKFGNKLDSVFKEHKDDFLSLDYDVNEVASCCVEILEKWDAADDGLEADKIIYEYLGCDLTKKNDTSYIYELSQLTAYKRAIGTVKNYYKSIIDENKAFRSKDYNKYVKDRLSFVKYVIKAIQARATYAAKLILKAAKIAKKQGANIPDNEIDKMDADILDIDIEISYKRTEYKK